MSKKYATCVNHIWSSLVKQEWSQYRIDQVSSNLDVWVDDVETTWLLRPVSITIVVWCRFNIHSVETRLLQLHLPMSTVTLLQRVPLPDPRDHMIPALKQSNIAYATNSLMHLIHIDHDISRTVRPDCYRYVFETKALRPLCGTRMKLAKCSSSFVTYPETLRTPTENFKPAQLSRLKIFMLIAIDSNLRNALLFHSALQILLVAQHYQRPMNTVYSPCASMPSQALYLVFLVDQTAGKQMHCVGTTVAVITQLFRCIHYRLENVDE